jgi:translation initiation factor 1A
MGRRREEKVDEEYLAQLMGGEAAEKIRVKMPNTKVNEMFAIADQILGGRRVNVVCADGKTRMARIPGKMRRRQYVREGDLIIVWPWDFQDAKADVKHRYNKTQALYLSRKGILPEIVDIFGMGASDEGSEDDDLFASPDEEESGQEPDDTADETSTEVGGETTSGDGNEDEGVGNADDTADNDDGDDLDELFG